MVQIGDAIVSFAMFQEYFCCNPSHCKGICCVEGDAGAPVAMDEVEKLEEALEVVENAQALALRFGIISEANKREAYRNLIRFIKEKDEHIYTGMIGA
ncbi:MAG: DUF3109 family protein, partial [Bacteroidaceae bacterium]|nr:DUF3109 family protein [Bacteroidaceae bacterium]